MLAYLPQAQGMGGWSEMRYLITVVCCLWILIIFVGAIWLTTLDRNDFNVKKDIVTSRTYKGRLYLEEPAYSQLKKYLADHSEITIARMDVYSPPDTLVDFVFYVQSDTEIPYGKITHTSYERNGRLTVVIIVVACLVGIIGLGIIAKVDESIEF
jgi:hypothetical protein